MIERVFIKEYLSLKDIDIEFENGLIVFSGPSGAGKSIFLQALLGILALSPVVSTLGEVSVRDFELSEEFVEADDGTVIRQIKKDKIRFFINSQTVSKQRLKEMSANYLFSLNHKESNEFSQENLLLLLDKIAQNSYKNHLQNLEKYKKLFGDFIATKTELEQLEQKAQKLEDLKEFARFEINKIKELNPKIGEDEELIKIKKMLSKKDKMAQVIASVENLFEFERDVGLLYELVDMKTDMVDDVFNEIRGAIESAQYSMEELNEIDVEEVLERLEKIGELKRRFGGIQEALEYQKEKEKELKEYEVFDDKIQALKLKLKELNKEVTELSAKISTNRQKVLKKLENELNKYLQMLYMKNATVKLNKKEISHLGEDEVEILINHTKVTNLSSGEFNRLRLSLLALKAKLKAHTNTKVLILDEIDANLSGEESKSVAKLLKFLSLSFQIFAISHQPHLSSLATHHYLVIKENEKTVVKKLNKDERIKEISRIISGNTHNKEALLFAREMINANNAS